MSIHSSESHPTVCSAHAPASRHHVRPFHLILAALAFVATLSANASRLAATQPATTQPAAKLNILFAIADDWGYGHAGAYGARWVQTPSFDRVAREGLLFTHAYTPNAKCAPSRACLLTGRNSWQLKEAANHICYFPPEFKSWMEVLGERGWNVGHTTKGWGPGVAQDEQGKPRQMTGRAFNRRTAAPATSEIGRSDYAANFVDFLDQTAADKPWCFWYGAIEPHRGYEFGSGVAKGGKQLTDVPRVPGYWPDNETTRHDMLDYAYEVEHFDRHLGRMLAELERRGQLDDTLVIVTSDHGMPFPRCKGNAYDFANRVPLAIRWPRGIRAAGRRIDDYVSFIDMAPTIIELAGLSWQETGLAESPGRSLNEIFRSDRAGRVVAARDHVLIGMERHDIGRPNDVGYPIRGIIQNDVAYLVNFEPSRWPACNPETGYLNCDGGATKTFILDEHRRDPSSRAWALCFGLRPGEELYRLSDDPDCLANLAANADMQTLKNSLRERLTSELKRQGDPRMEGRGEIFDQYPHANAGHRNFYERFMRGEKLKTGWVNASDYEPAPLP